MTKNQNLLLLAISIGAILLAVFSLDKGASNNDEFFSLLIYKSDCPYKYLSFDFNNIPALLHDFFFGQRTLLTFRYSRIIFNLTFTCLTLLCLTRIFVLKKIEKKYFILIATGILLASLSAQFNRGLHYNDLIDQSIVLGSCILFFLQYNNKQALAFAVLPVFIVCAFILFFMKFPIALILIFSFLVLLYRHREMSKMMKFLFILFFSSTSLLLAWLYIRATYTSIAEWLNSYTILYTCFFTGNKITVYSIDVVALTIVVLLTALNYRFKLLSPKTLSLKNLLIGLILLAVLEIYLYSELTHNPFDYFLYYAAMDLVVFIVWISLMTHFLLLVISRSDTRARVNILFISFLMMLLLSFLGSYMLQIINSGMHIYLVTVAIFLLMYKLNVMEYSRVWVVFLLIFFLSSVLLNPFVYNNRSVFQMKEPVMFPGNETVKVDADSKNFYETLRRHFQDEKGATAMNIDFMNVIYFLQLCPDIEINTVDEQTPDIFTRTLDRLNYLGIKYAKPEYLFCPRPIDTTYFVNIDKYYGVRKSDSGFVIKDPTSSAFKRFITDGNLYIYRCQEDSLAVK